MNDFISRQAAIDAISCDITVTGRQNAELVAATIGTFADRIKALPSAQPEQQWIPCSERLPEIGVNVLTVWTYEEYEPDIVVAHLKEWNGELYFDDVFGEYDHALKDVPAWMPLPEPWRGGEDGV